MNEIVKKFPKIHDWQWTFGLFLLWQKVFRSFWSKCTCFELKMNEIVKKIPKIHYVHFLLFLLWQRVYGVSNKLQSKNNNFLPFSLKACNFDEKLLLLNFTPLILFSGPVQRWSSTLFWANSCWGQSLTPAYSWGTNNCWVSSGRTNWACSQQTHKIHKQHTADRECCSAGQLWQQIINNSSAC